MKIRYERPVCYTAFWSHRLGLFALVLFAISAGLHRFGIMETEIFVVLFTICAGLALLAFLMAAYGILRLWMVGAEGGRASARGSLYAVLVLIPAGIAGFRAATLPPLYDISTDTSDVPDFLEPVTHGPDWFPQVALLEVAPYAGQEKAYPQVTGRRYEGALDRVLEAVRLVAENEGIRISVTKLPEPEEAPVPTRRAPAAGPREAIGEIEAPAEEPDDDSVIGLSELVADDDPAIASEPMVLRQAQIVIQGETRTPIFGFTSDISIRLSEEAETTFVDMRSQSRFGPHDLGTNAQIIAGFLRALDTELVGISVR